MNPFPLDFTLPLPTPFGRSPVPFLPTQEVRWPRSSVVGSTHVPNLVRRSLEQPWMAVEDMTNRLHDLSVYYALLRAQILERSAKVGIDVHPPPAPGVGATYGCQTAATSPRQVLLAAKPGLSTSPPTSDLVESAGSALGEGGPYANSWSGYSGTRRALSLPAPASGKRAKRWISRTCMQCSTNVTSQWRTGPAGPSTLCNACGIQHRRVLRKAKGREAKRLKRSYSVETECERNPESLSYSDDGRENAPDGQRETVPKRTAEVDGIEKRSDVYLLLN